MSDAGEDFLDYHGSCINPLVFAGYIMAKEPDLVNDIIEVLNQEYGDKILEIQDLIMEKYASVDHELSWNEKGCETLYGYICELYNKTKDTKKRLNKALLNIEDE